ncbi:stage IV sporulation protein B [Clostridium argentinense CDC 2741]|uniref:Stage IV sporulation protein B n=1 Tax=Clostridium argentinense CDC 2741 TaxID=1418104 RepID=A0A0C1U659_9CLOT|nr:SpoIVB peptidase [Clostridium argentinense]ARC85221.1 SpoIVB peptidase [Clostridium argentinense]KIE48189.1 stage IV sporulation protein B [Clostridium argentinense CDC 2741]NFF39475.1 SpoIVB peptidase [Clostridium argentinense]NFP50978.1 SpoIVB peptidase [Clostridium argentinense]NFP73628.1 SpoIVB peptidase [Clostridium argentinense]
MKRWNGLWCFFISIFLSLTISNYSSFNEYIFHNPLKEENRHIEAAYIKDHGLNNIPSSSINDSSNNDILLTQSTYAKTSEIKLCPGGQPVGIKLNTKGALIIALSDIETKDGIVSPATKAGIQIGDSIIKINGVDIKSSEDVSTYVNRCNGDEITITVWRKDETLDIAVKPVLSANDGKYKIGLWVRDSTAGVGTLTFYDNNTGKFGALGHPITDVDTGNIMNISNGEVVSSNIVSVRKGTKGNPGELRGIFVDEEKCLGNIYNNTECGVFGEGNIGLINKSYSDPLPVASRDEIKIGKAQILTTVEGSEPRVYDIEIEKLLPQKEAGSKSMIIRITDKEFLEKTGGIVQGMSGSPIIQNGKIIGAVTHVLINKPDTGYGIYIDWMLNDAGILPK